MITHNDSVIKTEEESERAEDLAQESETRTPDGKTRTPDGETPGTDPAVEEGAVDTEAPSSSDAAQSPVGQEAAENGGKKKKKRKKGKQNPRRTALIVTAVILVAAAVIIPIIFVNWGALFKPVKYRQVRYYKANYTETAFENEEYLSHAGNDMSVSVKMLDDVEHIYSFSDLASARDAFNELRGGGYGCGTIGDYFYQLIEGCTTPRQQEAFGLLFTEDCRIYGGSAGNGGKVSDVEKPQELPETFPSQKVYNIHLYYFGKYEKDGETLYRWRVSFDVVRNDGTVLNYTGARDGGEAWFWIVDRGGAYRIDEISGIISVN